MRFGLSLIRSDMIIIRKVRGLIKVDSEWVLRVSLFIFFSILFVNAISLKAVAHSNGQASLPDKHPLDTSKYHRFVLDNGLKVILLSDSKLNKSSASICVNVGSLMDPPEHQGLAHFYEHMSFLGTKKYPEAKDYQGFLKTHGGYSNAYTAPDHTNYYFEVYHDVLDGALDRFSQFFISPLFTENYTEREKNAVHSEHQKNIESDSWRMRQVKTNFYNPNHPANHFSTGNLTTLANVSRNDLLGFMEKYYTASQMSLSIASNHHPEMMEQWVRKYFSEIDGRKSEPIVYPSDYLLPKQAFRIAVVEPVKDVRRIQLEFSLPSIDQHYKSKPVDLISFQIGDEGAGSLLSYLKSKGLATGLSVAAYDPSPAYGSLLIDISLTEKGLELHREVVRHVFSYIQNMREEGYKMHLFKERRMMARLEKLYSDKGEGSDRAVSLANALRKYPIEVVEEVPYMFTEENPLIYEDMLSHLRPDNMLCILTAKGINTDKVEPHYGSKYIYFEEEGEYFESLVNAPKIEALRLPESNRFIPKKVHQLAHRPVRLIDESGMTLYYSQDVQFMRPKVALFFRIRQTTALANLESYVLKQFYAECVKEALNEVSYPALVAGLNFSFSASEDALDITVNGFSESAVSLLSYIANSMKKFDMTDEKFADIKKNLIIMPLQNFTKEAAWKQAKFYKNEMLEKEIYSPSEQLVFAKTVSKEDVRKFIVKLFWKGHIEALIHGNLTAKKSKDAANVVRAALAMRATPQSQLIKKEVLSHDAKESILRVDNIDVKNSCFWREYYLGEDTPKNRAVSMMINNFVKPIFFEEMRTQRQLGYIVWGGSSQKEHTRFCYFIVQSSCDKPHTPDRISVYADEVINSLPKRFRDLKEEDFNALKESAKEKLMEKATSISGKAAILFEKAYRYHADFERNDQTVSAIESLDKGTVMNVLLKATQPHSARMRSVFLYGNGHEMPKDLKSTFEDLRKWKKQRTYK